MGLRDRRWHPWSGTPSGPLSRALVIPRYALGRLFAGRLFLAFCLLTWIVPLAFAVLIYMRHNAAALAFFGLTAERINQLWPLDGFFFRWLLVIQTPFAFLAALHAAPTVAIPDLRTGGLPLLLSRPLRPWGWVAGKVAAVAAVLSFLTWIPASLCLVLQASVDPRWVLENVRIALGIVAVGVLTAIWFALLGVAVATLARTKPAATAVIFGTVSVFAAVGGILEGGLGIEAGASLQFWDAGDAIFRLLLGLDRGDASPVTTVVVLLSLAAGALAILWARIRPMEIVR
jgi:hypothetical protein